MSALPPWTRHAHTAYQRALDHHRLGRAPLQLLGVSGVLGAGIAFGSLAWLTGNLANALVGSGPWAPASFRPAGPST
ncbi:hypothetical protein [Streptomyces avermitilis]|uniref:hypothetical protein n=1 Tax=Streptomyces avermitilis TaxID=33903 RepID=UPI0033B06961